MSWRIYQASHPVRSRNPRRWVGWLFVAIGTIALGSQAYRLFRSLPEPAAKSGVLQTQEERGVSQWVRLSDLTDGANQYETTRRGVRYTVNTSMDEELQGFIDRKLARYRVDWGGIAVLDPRNGEVLALSSHSEREADASNLALRATFPAASVFKVVTAAAAVERVGARADTPIAFDGNLYRMRKRELLRVNGRESMTLGRAFARSANVIFGKMGAHAVGGDLLREYSEKFGFGIPIPFDAVVGTSEVHIPASDVMADASVAAGFGAVTLSPLHGALIAGAVLNDGRMMRPRLVRTVESERGELVFRSESDLWRTSFEPSTASELRKMMRATIGEGTARRPFRGVERSKYLSRLDIGGKTGSLTGKNPRGKTEWFVGFARGANREIAVGISIVNEEVWRVKPAELAREIFEYHFGTRPAMEARARGIKETAWRKKL